MKLRTIVFATVMSAIAFPAFADVDHPYNFTVQKTVELKDGGTLYVFKDGKMTVCDKYGNPDAKVKAGTSVQTKSGETIVITSNELQRMVSTHSTTRN